MGNTAADIRRFNEGDKSGGVGTDFEGFDFIFVDSFALILLNSKIAFLSSGSGGSPA